MADLPDLAKTETAIVRETNAFRQTKDLSQLKRNAALDAAARAFAKYLAKSGRFAHEADGRQPADRAKAAGYAYCTIAENLSMNLDSRGFKTEQLARDTMDGWKKSPGHLKNLTLPGVTEIGVGIARAPGPDPKFLSVQLFGRPESLAFQFSVTNKSHVPATYTYGGQSYTIEPLQIATHKGCDPGEIVFERSGSWLTGSRLNAHYKARNGVQYVLRPGPDGHVHVHMMK
ncbi:MAG: CAP domain-containing protein [Hyphomicrobiaceae bacterium]